MEKDEDTNWFEETYSNVKQVSRSYLNSLMQTIAFGAPEGGNIPPAEVMSGKRGYVKDTAEPIKKRQEGTQTVVSKVRNYQKWIFIGLGGYLLYLLFKK